MYEELVKKLRDDNACLSVSTLQEAADAIDELSAAVAGYEATTDVEFVKEDGHCTKYSDDKVTSWCVQLPCEDEKPSNADLIRAMSDEELAIYLSELANGDCPIIGDCPDGMKEKTTCTPSECWASWLKSPVEEG